MPARQPKRGRLWPNEGSCVRLGAERANHLWSYDFVHHQTHDGGTFRTLNVLDEFTRESLAIRVRRKLSSADVIDVLTDPFILWGPPAFVRSDNGPEFVAEAVRRWIAAVGARTALIEPGSPRKNGYIESFNPRFRDELLDGEIFYSLKKAQVVIEAWQHYNTICPHSSLGYRPPAPETIVPPSWPPAPLRSSDHPAWRRSQPCTNIEPGPDSGAGQSAERRLGEGSMAEEQRIAVVTGAAAWSQRPPVRPVLCWRRSGPTPREPKPSLHDHTAPSAASTQGRFSSEETGR